MAGWLQAQEKLSSFRELLPLVKAVCSPGMRERHWEEISNVTGIDISSDTVCSLRWLLDSNCMDSLDSIIAIADTASNEWSLQKALLKMLSDWESLCFELADWKSTGAQAAMVAA
jgi:dynein heavy chain, axonemal